MSIYPLTKPQMLIYDMERFAGGAVSNMAASILFKGEADISALEKAINLIIKTSDALRLQILPDATQTVLEYHEEKLEHKSFDRAEDFHLWAQEYAREPIDMSGKLYRFFVITIKNEHFGAMMKLHHLTGDAWSAALYGSRLYEYYSLIKNGTVPEPVKYSYLDYITRERSYLDSVKYQKDRDFWLAQFEKCPDTAFISEKTSSDMDSDRKDIILSKEDTGKIRSFAEANGLSVFALIFTALSVYISRIRGKSSFYIGTTVLNRAGAAEKNTFGMFVNTVAIPVNIDEDAGFLANAMAVGEGNTSVFRHQKYNYNDVLSDVSGKYSFNEKLYDVLLNYQNAAATGMDDSFERTWWYHCGRQPESLQIQVNDRDNKGELYICYDFQTDKFSIREIELLHERLFTILMDGLENPQKSVCELEIMPECEKKKVRYDFNDTDVPYPDIKCVHKYFEKNAAENPSRTALVFGEKRISYGELNKQSDKVAFFLRERGVKPGGVVALLTERCAEMLPLMLGAMKAGCAYMPVSTSLPRDRIDFMLEDSCAALLFYQRKFAGMFGPNITAVEAESLNRMPEATYPLESENDPSKVAYILYTSGSTGRPKGVQVGQFSLCNRLLWMESRYPLNSDDILIQKTNYAFDVSAWELFWAFMQGKALLVPEPGAEKDPRRLIELIREEKVSKIHFVPSMLTVFLDYLAASGEKLPELSHVFVSGEALTTATNRRFYDLFAETGAGLYNLYGPTECTVDVLYYDCSARDEEIPIGRPVWNTRAYILDKNGQALPPGIQGELCISGVQLARGYVDSTLDEGRFVEHPLLGRIYKTGDIASLREDGQILYFGRNDSQVKIRGQRVELAEIEAQISGQPGVSQSAIIFDGERLRAFYTAPERLSEGSLMESMRERLPSYMVPDICVYVEEFPLNANGKLDKNKLLSIAQRQDAVRYAAKTAEPPATEQERQLLFAVCARLKRNDIGVNENLLQLGLTSLDIISIIAELEEQGTELKVNDFYTHGTVRELAQNSSQKERPLLHVFNPANTDLAIIGIPYGGGSFGSFADLAAELKSCGEYPLIAVQSAEVKPEDLLREIKALPYRRYALLGCCVGSALTIELARLLDAEEESAALVVFLLSSIPPKGVRFYGRFFNPWQISGDGFINKYLRGLSEKDFRLGPREIEQFRKDVGFFLRYLARNRQPELRAGVHVLYGGGDPMIKGGNVEREWQKYLGKKVDVKEIDAAKHYIVHTHARETAEFVLDNISRL